MGLTLTGQQRRTATGTNAKAIDDGGETVIVSATDEAIKDHGWPQIEAVAGKKYDSGNVNRSGTYPIVTVGTSDF